ncbi:hypothetical protein D9757_008126 [Collybiopsis confluens]|uniref:Uncharacterized protein n=1 Tax=Collybiopsis confluens TaxID=2823264 RepID=A0A8H5HDV4_9AGAR|nr:hypothetical protein D9757_008126 [Collybiopsis confluens]
MDSPSWTDALHSAFSSCLHCFQSSSSDSDLESTQNRGRPPRHLESLLAEPQDTDTEAETVSLHSNIGDNSRRRQRRQQKKKNGNITLFGFDLFGKRPTTGPIHLSGDEDEGEASPGLHRSRRRPSRTSSLTFDGNVSDAAPLDSAAIGERIVEVGELRVAKEREREERRKMRKERKELKRLAQSYPNIPSPFQHAVYLQNPLENFGGPYHRGPAAPPVEDDEADFDGGLYAARKPNDGSSVSGGGSDSRRSPSGTSASRSDYSSSNPSPLPANFIQPHLQNLHPHVRLEAQPKLKKKKSKKSSPASGASSFQTKSSSSQSRSSASATSSDQTPSLASPVSTLSPVLSDGGVPSPLNGGAGKKPSLMMHFEDGPAFSVEERSFPSSGLGFGSGGMRGSGGRGGNAFTRSGAFLASRD